MNHNDIDMLHEDEMHRRIEPHLAAFFGFTEQFVFDRMDRYTVGYDSIVSSVGGEPLAYLEYKRRYVRWNQYSSWMVAVSKIDNLWRKSNPNHAACAVQFDDRLGMVHIEDIHRCQTFMGGRMDRGKSEREPCYFVPMGRFWWIKDSDAKDFGTSANANRRTS